ncbi:MAG: prepilin-type N-terminal cleavage/methylation domain-containing protein [Verrucomicrobiota bacterium]
MKLGTAKNRRAFTLIELLVVMVVIAVLVSIGVPSYQSQKRSAERAVCMSQMRTIHVALDNYITENNHWPQIPTGIFESDNESDFWKWWILTLEPYGAGEQIWLCPSDKVRKESEDEYNGSYLPTKFDAHHHTPYRWAAQPWLLERGDLHKKGAHILMLDGSIHSSRDAY